MKSIFYQYLTFLLAISMLFYVMKPIVFQIEYSYFNQTFTAQFCVNKSKPALKCNGKCYLKTINSTKESFQDTKKVPMQMEVLFFKMIESYQIFQIESYPSISTFFRKRIFCSNTIIPIEHPPQV